MSNHFPITPPPELVEQWWNTMPGSTTKCLTKLATLAAQWGANQELEACCHEVQNMYSGGSRLRAARRPEPEPVALTGPALEDLRSIELLLKEHKMVACTFNIRRALEALND
jgi:hypothetical protein